MSERPFMQLYVSDFVGDTLHLSSEQVGVYLLLLMAMWNADGSLPDDDAKLARVARLSLKKWKVVRPELMEFFTVADGHVTHGRLTKELQKSERQSQSRSAAGAKGFAAKSLKYNKPAQANAQAGLKHSPEPYRKGGATRLVPTDGPAAMVRLDRTLHPELFSACETVRGKTAPSSPWSFPADVYAKAVVIAQQQAAMLETADEGTAH